jgi:hypothetical protein
MNQNFNNTVVSLIRTYVPVVVGALVSWLIVHYGWHVSKDIQVGADTALTAFIIAAYYTLVRLLENKFPWLGVLLGHVAKPTYVKAGGK